MAKKAETETKPGYSDEGMTPRAADVLMTYRIEGAEDPQNVADYLWGHWRKGTDAQRPEIGPRIEGGAVVYTFYTVYRGESQEKVELAGIKSGIENVLKDKRAKVTMSYVSAPALPPVMPGVDAPAVIVVGV